MPNLPNSCRITLQIYEIFSLLEHLPELPYQFEKMNDHEGESLKKKKIKKKLSKAQVQLAIIKKKQCDAKALMIVEQLIEPIVNPNWLLENLAYINKSHMEDVIEERAILKLCGYVLCQKSLTVIIKQQYHISTKKNKVYDITRRKNFCSATCYGASSYLLEQMLTSPLWLREKEEIPEFQILESTDHVEQSRDGEEINMSGSNIMLNDSVNEKLKSDKYQQTETETSLNLSKHIESQQFYLGNEKMIEKDMFESNKPTLAVISSNEPLYGNQDGMRQESKTALNQENVYANTTFNGNLTSEACIYQEYDEGYNHTDQNNLISNQSILNFQILSGSSKQNIIRENDEHKGELPEMYQPQYSNINNKFNLNTTSAKETGVLQNKEFISNRHIKYQKSKKREIGNTEEESTELYSLTMHIEQCVNEWITEDTLKLLGGEENTKNRLLEGVSQYDKYLQVCKKLNKLQLEDEEDNPTDLEKSNLKPLPNLSDLQEDGKKIELKVRAFYEDNLTIQESTPNKTCGAKNEPPPILPLTDVHAPKALRRRILLDKLHKIIPELLRALTANKQTDYYHQLYSGRSSVIRVLVTTFALSAANIIFRTTEWTLVGLIIIKMLSAIDPQLRRLLASKQASMYISMILMSYKLDSNYLDRLLIELTNNTEIFKINLSALS